MIWVRSFNKMISGTVFGLLMLSCASATANVQISFVEGAPKDRFTIKNAGNCDLVNAKMTVDLTSSAGGLIFDTTADGAGVEVFQPFESTDNQQAVLLIDPVSDGDQHMSIRIPELAVGTSVSFTIDVDDTLVNSELGQIRVSDSEIAGGTVAITLGNSDAFNASFDSASRVVIEVPCPQ